MLLQKRSIPSLIFDQFRWNLGEYS